MNLLITGICAFLINLPFGAWRAHTKKFSWKWFLAVHTSIPIVYAIRIYEGISWRLLTFLVLIPCYFAGQFLGSKFHSKKNTLN